MCPSEIATDPDTPTDGPLSRLRRSGIEACGHEWDFQTALQWTGGRPEDPPVSPRAPTAVLVHAAPEGSATGAQAERAATGDGRWAELARRAGVGLRVERVEIALTGDHAWLEQSLQRGTEIADRMIDAGADLLIPSVPRSRTPMAAALTGTLLLPLEPVEACGLARAGFDQEWMKLVAAVRDARWLAADVDGSDGYQVLAAVGSRELAVLSGLVWQAAVRRTPAMLSGPTVVAAAAVVHSLEPDAGQWWRLAARSTELVESRLAESMEWNPVSELALPAGEGLAAMAVTGLLTQLNDLRAQD